MEEYDPFDGYKQGMIWKRWVFVCENCRARCMNSMFLPVGYITAACEGKEVIRCPIGGNPGFKIYNQTENSVEDV